MFQFLQQITLSLLTLLGPLDPPQMLLDFIGTTEAYIAVNNPTLAPWTRVYGEMRKDPLGSFNPSGIQSWRSSQAFGQMYLGSLEPGTTYEFRARSLDSSSGRFSAWTTITLTTGR